jgi:Peptidase family M28
MARTVVCLAIETGGIMRLNRVVVLGALCALVAGSCSSGDDDVADSVTQDSAAEVSAPATDSVSTDLAVTDPVVTGPTDTEPVDTDPPVTDSPADRAAIDPIAIVEMLASDELNGRNNQTDESTAARELLLPFVTGLADPADPEAEGTDGYLQVYDAGTNILGVMPGRGALAEEYVLIGAHYDHLGPGECDIRGAIDDTICNGAADNAAGVASLLSIVDALAARDSTGDDSARRSVIIGLWDGEEDGLIGSQIYVDDPAVPLEQTVAYVNFDIQGVSLTPSLVKTTVLVGPETGGAVLVDAAARATGASELDYATFSLIFGQGRSDHANLVAAGVASVFFTDANNGCYHTVLDDIEHLDTDKLMSQIATAQTLFFDLLTIETPPTFVPDTPLSTYADAEALLDVVVRAEPDFALLGEAEAATRQFLVELQAIVDAGPGAYDDAAGGVVLGGAATLVAALGASECTIPS